MGAPRKTNLHAVWDDGLIRRRGMEYQAYARKLEEGIKPAHLATFTAFMDPLVWASESHLLAEEFAYRDHRGNWIKSGDTLGDDYANKNTPTVDEQLTKAGLRLARMLNDIFDPGSEMPATPASPAVAPAPAPTGASAPAPGHAKFVGSRNSEVYHFASCPTAAKIASKNLVEYDSPRRGRGCTRGARGKLHGAAVVETTPEGENQ